MDLKIIILSIRSQEPQPKRVKRVHIVLSQRGKSKLLEMIYIAPHPPEKCYLRLPWWLGGQESTGQCRRYGFDP